MYSDSRNGIASLSGMDNLSRRERQSLMPCRSYPEDYPSATENLPLRTLVAQSDKVTRLLCEVCTAFEDHFMPIPSWRGASDELVEWWEDHKKKDEVRNEHESNSTQ